MDEILLKQNIIALSVTLNFYGHAKNGCNLCWNNDSAENITIENSESLFNWEEVLFPVVRHESKTFLIVAIDTYGGELVLYGDYEVYRVYGGGIYSTGEYMSLQTYKETV